MKAAILFLSLLACTLLSHSQTLKDFSLKNVIDGKTASLKEFSSQPGLVIIFTSVACPFDGYYVNRLKELQSTFATKIPVLLVNAYTEAPEGEEWMVKTAAANNLTLPYLSDKEQVLMNLLGAQRSPEAFLLKNTNEQFSVVYRGALDDNAQAEVGVKQAYLKQAIEALLAGKSIARSNTRPVGCYIRKK